MQEQFMAEAIRLSLENVKSGAGGPFAALVVRNGKIIGRGTNQVTRLNDPSAHAEVLAIREACRTINSFQLRGCEVYTTCEPCPMCLGVIYWARPDRVYYANSAADAAAIGFDDSRIYQQISVPHAERSIPMLQIMRDQALSAFHAWQAKPDKVPY
jgi:guanine deaminase